MQMPDGKYLGDSLAEAVASGSVPETRINDATLRILWAMFSVGIFDEPEGKGNLIDTVTSNKHNALARRLAEEGTVLLKNEGGILPLEER